MGETHSLQKCYPCPRNDLLPMWPEQTNTEIDWVSLARSFGIDAERVNTMDEFSSAIDAGFATRGPYLIEVAF